MGPLEKSLYTSIEMEEKRVQIIFMECYYMASHYGALNEIKERCLYTARNGWLPDLPNRLHLEKATKRGPPSFFYTYIIYMRVLICMNTYKIFQYDFHVYYIYACTHMYTRILYICVYSYVCIHIRSSSMTSSLLPPPLPILTRNATIQHS